jgi:uncharacterized membrane protein (DUF373 family)
LAQTKKAILSKYPAWRKEMLVYLKKFENYILNILIIMIALVILVSTVELGWIIVKDLMKPPKFLLSISDLKEIFGFFLLVLIGIELLETIKAYLVEHVVQVIIILEVALIALARKVIILDFEKYDGITTVGIAVLVIAIASAFYVVKQRIPANS